MVFVEPGLAITGLLMSGIVAIVALGWYLKKKALLYTLTIVTAGTISGWMVTITNIDDYTYKIFLALFVSLVCSVLTSGVCFKREEAGS